MDLGHLKKYKIFAIGMCKVTKINFIATLIVNPTVV